MTIKELIKIFEKLPEDTLVLVDGYEDGLSDIALPHFVNVDLNVNFEDYYGPHSIAENGKIKAVVLHRSNNTNKSS